MMEDQEYIDAIENGNPKAVEYESRVVKEDSKERVVDYTFDCGVVIRQTYIPFEAAQPPGVVVVGYPLKYKLEFNAPEFKKGYILKEVHYDD